jgi:hypothetical protein
MQRWLIELIGEPFDVEEFSHWFPPGAPGEPYAVHDAGKTYVVPVVPDSAEAADAEEAAITVLDDMYAAIRLVQAGVRRPTIGTVYREDADGNRQGFALLRTNFSGRFKLRAMLGPQPLPSAPTQAQQLLAAARGDRHLSVALSILALPHASWPHLYRVLEEVEASLGSGVVDTGLCTGAERSRFTRTANAGESGGLNARHRLGGSVPHSNPMSLVEGTGFITGLLIQALRRKSIAGAA